MTDESKFVNRRGHAKLISEDDVLQIDGEPVVTKAHKNKALRVKRPRRRVHLARWQKATIGIILFSLLALPVVVGEIVKADYENSAANAIRQVNDLTNTVVLPQQKNPALTAKEMATVVESLAATRDSMCSGAFVDNMATLYPPAKTALEACLQTRNKVDALASAMADSAGQLAYLEQLQPIFSATEQSEEERFAVLTSQQENWRSLVDGLKQLNPPTSFRPAHEALVQKAEAVANSWTEVVNAFSAQDSAAFATASAKVTTTYGELRATADAFQSAVNATQTKLTDSQEEIL